MTVWNDFFLATAGAAAALTGLIFVSVSISLTKIISITTLPNRALLSIIILLAILISSILFLVPQQSEQSLGVEILIMGVLIFLAVLKIDLTTFRQKEKRFKRHYMLIMFLNQLAVVPYIICGFAMVAFGSIGIYWIVWAIVFSFIKAVLDAWVLLVEINM